jgi:predicted hydrolase (HD superfamily)
MKQKDFARRVNREQIRLCEEIGVPLEDFAELSLRAMQGISDQLGL